MSRIKHHLISSVHPTLCRRCLVWGGARNPLIMQTTCPRAHTHTLSRNIFSARARDGANMLARIDTLIKYTLYLSHAVQDISRRSSLLHTQECARARVVQYNCVTPNARARCGVVTYNQEGFWDAGDEQQEYVVAFDSNCGCAQRCLKVWNVRRALHSYTYIYIYMLGCLNTFIFVPAHPLITYIYSQMFALGCGARVK